MGNMRRPALLLAKPARFPPVNGRHAMSDSLITIPVSVGELIDKITILELKGQHIRDPKKLGNIRTELDHLRRIRDGLAALDKIVDLETSLFTVNSELWQVEDALRMLETEQDFGDQFVTLARSVYKLNDHRAALKYEINQITGSGIVEEKSYAQ